MQAHCVGSPASVSLEMDLGRFLLYPASERPIDATIETATIIVLPRRVSNQPDFLEISSFSLLDC